MLSAKPVGKAKMLLMRAFKPEFLPNLIKILFFFLVFFFMKSALSVGLAKDHFKTIANLPLP